MAMFGFALPVVAQVNPHTQIRWPAGCGTGTGKVYNQQTNACVDINAIDPSAQITWPGVCNSPSQVYVPQSNSCKDINAINPATQITWPASACNSPSQVYVPQSNSCKDINAINPGAQITWPASCTPGTLYNPSSNTCVTAGSANNPGGSNKQIQFNNGGFFGGDSRFSFDVVTGITSIGNVNSGISNGDLNPVQAYGADPSGAADSFTAINSACSFSNANGNSITLPPGTYKVSASLSNCGTSPIKFRGSGVGRTIINYTGTTGYVFPITYSAPGGQSTYTIAGEFSGFQVNQATGVTPTAGGGFLVGSGVAGQYTIGLRVRDIQMNNLFGGIYTQTGQISNWFEDIYCNSMKSGGTGCVFHNSASPSGDDHYNNIEATGASTGFTVAQSDIIWINQLKLNGSPLSFTGAGPTLNVQVNAPSIEGSMPCGVSFSGSSTINNISFVGGEMNGQPSAAVCNTAASASYTWASLTDLTPGNATGAVIHDLGGGKVAPQFFTKISGNCTGQTPFATGGCSYMTVGQIPNGASGIQFQSATTSSNLSSPWIAATGNGTSTDLRLYTGKNGTTFTSDVAQQAVLFRSNATNTSVWMLESGGATFGTNGTASTDPGLGNIYAQGTITAGGAFISGPTFLSVTGSGAGVVPWTAGSYAYTQLYSSGGTNNGGLSFGTTGAGSNAAQAWIACIYNGNSSCNLRFFTPNVGTGPFTTGQAQVSEVMVTHTSNTNSWTWHNDAITVGSNATASSDPGANNAYIQGVLNVAGGYSANGTAGVTSATCTAWTNGLCTHN
jgi:hypothetical protein